MTQADGPATGEHDFLDGVHGAEAEAEGEEDGTRAVPTNLRPMLIMEAVARAGAPVTPTEVNAALAAQGVGLPKPTVHRLFATLEEEGFLQREIDGRSYSPGRRMNRLAVETVSAVRVRGARMAVLTTLAERIGETCNVAIPDRDAMVYLDRVETKWPLRIQLPRGTRVPLHCTASGKMYLSSLEPARRERMIAHADYTPRTGRSITSPEGLRPALAAIDAQGYATDDEEFIEGMVALAVPVRDRQGQLFATLSFHAPTQRMSVDGAVRHLGTLRAAASELEGIVNDTRDPHGLVDR